MTNATTKPKAPRKPRGKTAPKEITSHAVRFTFPELVQDTDEDIIIELCCFVKGKRGGLGDEFKASLSEWNAMLTKMAAKGVTPPSE